MDHLLSSEVLSTLKPLLATGALVILGYNQFHAVAADQLSRL